MFLQLHDGPGMAGEKFPQVQDLNLPDALKIPQRQILLQAIDEGGAYALKQLQKAEDKNNTNQDLPTLDTDNLELLALQLDLEDLEGEGSGLGAWYVATAKFLIKYGQVIWDVSKNFAKTVSLWKVNNRIDDAYQANYYQVQNLNNLTAKQIDAQLAIISGDLLNATAQKEKIDAMVLSRYSQIYQQRKIMLPAFSSTTLKYAGAALLAYFLLKK
tara:strand:+ start:437 stop:1081 length:645 start_codon:yes stop_codon:yes gene_type:complete